MAETMSALVPLLGQALLHFLWQGALVGLLAALVLGVLRDARPQARYLVACLALMACALAPVLTMLWPLLATSAAPVVATTAPAASALTTATFATGSALVDYVTPATGIEAWHPAIVATWAAGMGMMSLRIVMGLAWIRRLPLADDRVQQLVWQSRLDVMAMHFKLSRAVELRLVHALDTPAATGWVRPVVLLPAALLSRLPADLIEALLAHELAHIRRHDYLVNLLQNAVEAVLFYHPVTWWLSHRIRVEREQVADQLAAEVICAPRRLALALSELTELQRVHPALHLVQAAHGGQLMSRIERLVRPARRTHPGARIVFPLLGLAAFSMAAYSWARMDDPAGMEEPAAAVADADVTVAPDDADTTIRAKDPQVVTPDGEGIQHHGTIVVDSKVDKQRKVERDVVRRHSDRDFYALVDKHGKHIDSQGSLDMQAVETLKKLPDGQTLWFRRDGRDYVITDPVVLARAHAAWRDAEALGKKMEPLGARMEVYGKQMEALGEQMEALSDKHQPSERMRAAEREMRTLSRQQRALSREQSLLQDKYEDAPEDSAQQRDIERQMDALSGKMDALAARMDAQGRIMDEESRHLDEASKPMEELSRRMDLASKPMDELGRQMDALGKQMDVVAAKAERETHAIIDDAMAHDLARPMTR
jgi:beta-lactamase regulating signal transducer with metallopeptidase domain